MIPASGSAYTYSYVVFGELIAWIVGWSLILEYSLVVSAVAVGWSGYVRRLLGRHPAGTCATAPELGGIFNLPGDLHHRGRRRPADLRHARKRDAQRDPGRDQDAGAGAVHRRRAAGVQRRQLPSVHALRLRQAAARRARSRRHGRGGDHLLRFLRLRRDRDGGRGSQEPEPRPRHRHRRIDGRCACSSTWRSPPPRSARSPTRASPTAPSRWR